jgi:hypothetical protein
MKMVDFNPAVSIGPISLTYSDIVTVFKSIAEVFSGSKDPDKGIIQKSVLLENEITPQQIWRSKSTIELTHEIRNGLKVIYHYNSEALSRKCLFENYTQHVKFSQLPKNCDSTVFFIARNAVVNKNDHRLDNKNAMGFIALFTPPISRSEVIKYSYQQTYKSFVSLWGHPSEEINKDYRFLRQTQQFTRILKFPRDIYENVKPDCFLMDKDKKKKIGTMGKVNLEVRVQKEQVVWKVSAASPPKDTVLRIRWEKPPVI